MQYALMSPIVLYLYFSSDSAFIFKFSCSSVLFFQKTVLLTYQKVILDSAVIIQVFSQKSCSFAVISISRFCRQFYFENESGLEGSSLSTRLSLEEEFEAYSFTS